MTSVWMYKVHNPVSTSMKYTKTMGTGTNSVATANAIVDIDKEEPFALLAESSALLAEGEVCLRRWVDVPRTDGRGGCRSRPTIRAPPKQGRVSRTRLPPSPPAPPPGGAASSPPRPHLVATAPSLWSL